MTVYTKRMNYFDNYCCCASGVFSSAENATDVAWIYVFFPNCSGKIIWRGQQTNIVVYVVNCIFIAASS